MICCAFRRGDRETIPRLGALGTHNLHKGKLDLHLKMRVDVGQSVLL